MLHVYSTIMVDTYARVQRCLIPPSLLNLWVGAWLEEMCIYKQITCVLEVMKLRQQRPVSGCDWVQTKRIERLDFISDRSKYVSMVKWENLRWITSRAEWELAWDPSKFSSASCSQILPCVCVHQIMWNNSFDPRGIQLANHSYPENSRTHLALS